jgi:hypothetical protein
MAMIDANEQVIRRAARAVVSERHDADRQRVAVEVEGLRRVEQLAGRGELADGTAEWPRTTFSTGLFRTAALYGVKPRREDDGPSSTGL